MGLSTHVLDTASGRPATGVRLTLSMEVKGILQEIGAGMTDLDGRCRTLLGDRALEAGIYRLRFHTERHYGRQQSTGLYPYVDIAFTVRHPDEHYHIPLLLSPNGYTTYRGS